MLHSHALIPHGHRERKRRQVFAPLLVDDNANDVFERFASLRPLTRCLSTTRSAGRFAISAVRFTASRLQREGPTHLTEVVMKHKAPWIAAIALTAFSAGAIAVDNDSTKATRNAIEEGVQGPIANDPRFSSDDTQALDSRPTSDSRVMSRYDTEAADSRATGSDEARASRHTSSSAHAAAIAPSFAAADRDGNGVLDVNEATAAGINFNSANQDEDGVISMREYQLAIVQMGLEPSGDRS